MAESQDTKTVVVVDDEENIVTLLVEILRAAGYEAIGCSVWTEAMDAIGRANPDLVLLDLKMPTIDGPAMLEFIRKEGLDVPVIVVSGFVTDQVSENLSQLGVSAFVNKPFRAAEILAEVKKAIAGPATASNSMDSLYGSTRTQKVSSPAPSSDTSEVLAALQKLDGNDAKTTETGPPPLAPESPPTSQADEILTALQKHGHPGTEVSPTVSSSPPSAAVPLQPVPSAPRATDRPTPEANVSDERMGKPAETEPTGLSNSSIDESGRSVSVTEHHHHRPSPRRKRLTKRNFIMFSTMFIICLTVAGFMAAVNWFTAQIDVEELRSNTEKAITKQATKEILRQLKDSNRLP